MDPNGNADKWCKKIQEVWGKIYHNHQNTDMQRGDMNERERERDKAHPRELSLLVVKHF